MKTCPICGGATTCPDGDPITIVKRSDILQLDTGSPVPAGFQVTHRTKRYVIAIPATATVVGTAMSDRIVAHNPNLHRVWVGQCAYAFVSGDEA